MKIKNKNVPKFRSQKPAAKDYFSKVAAFTKKLDPTRPVTAVLNQVLLCSFVIRNFAYSRLKKICYSWPFPLVMSGFWKNFSQSSIN
jgi:hypothetical protein